MKRVAWPLTLIFVGIIFLLNNFSLLPWSIWSILWRFWPVMLILAGLETAFADSSWRGVLLAIISAVILVAILFLAVVWSKPSLVFYQPFKDRVIRWSKEFFPHEKKQEYVISDENYPNLNKRILNIDLGFGRLNLSDQEKNQSLFQLISHYQDPFGTPQIKTDLEESQTIIINFTNRQENIFFPNQLIDRINYQITLGKVNLPTEVWLEIGTGQAKVKLNKIPIEVLNCTVGTGQAHLIILEPSLPRGNLFLDIGTGQAEVTLPKETGINLNYNLGAGKIIIGEEEVSGLGKSGDFFFGQDNWPQIAVKAKVGTGSLTVKLQK